MSENVDIRELNERIEKQSAFVTNLMAGMDQVIVGQKHLVESLLIGLLSDGHILLEGVPGLAKTLAIKTLASLIDASFNRIQFTPDLLPADVVGTMIYSQKDETFLPKKGPVFANFILADEINRAPAKVQSALLEAMQERQVTLGGETFKLPKPFLVMATQNPIEQEGTYPLPEAQVDRFMLKAVIDYPKIEEEKKIIHQQIHHEVGTVKPVMTTDDIIEGSLKQGAEIQVKTDLLIDAVAKAENISFTEEEAEEYIKKVAEDSKATVEDIKKYFGEEYIMEQHIKEAATEILMDSAVVDDAPAQEAPAEEKAPEAVEAAPKKKPGRKKKTEKTDGE